MTFEEAEKKFRELQARVQRGEPISRADYEEQVAQLAVQDERGVLWEINPRTGKWMYFDGAEWVVGRPPGHDQSTVMPISQLTQAAPPTPPTTPQRPPTPSATTPPMRSTTPSQSTKPPVAPQPIKPPATPQPTKPSATPQPAKPPTWPSPRPAAPTPSSPRPAATSAPPSKAAPSPETVQPWTQKKPTTGARPQTPRDRGARPPAGAPGGAQKPARVITPFAGTNREWVPLAIGAVVLLFCAIVLFFGARIFLVSGSSGTPTRVTTRATPTAEPTVVRLPTATLPPPTPAPVLAKIIERTANVRAGPGKTFKVISTLKKDSQITLIGRNEAGDWFQVNVAGAAQPGWISSEVLQITGGDPNSLPVAGKSAAPAGPQAPPSLTPIGGPTSTPSS